jgi:HlyD family secretion protein
MANRGKSGLWFLVVLAIAGGGGYYWWTKEHADTGPEYRAAEVAKGDLTQVVTATGALNPVVNVQVGSQVSGIIKALFADWNSPVKSNQIVAQLDPASYQATYDAAAADLAVSKAARSLAKANAERAAGLFTNSLISHADYDTATANLEQAEATVLLKQATASKAKVDLANTTIYSPIDGVVIARNFDVGQTVAASFSAPTLFQIANDLSKMQIDAAVSEADVGGVETGQKVDFSVDAFPSRVFHGAVTQIRDAPVTNQNVISYDTVISVRNDDLKLLPGMTANVSIILAKKQDVLKIPNSALRFKPVSATEGQNAGGPRGAGGESRPTGSGGPGSTGASGGEKSGGGQKKRDRAASRTVYVLPKDLPAKGAKPFEPKPVQIRAGISDGVSTEVVDGLKEGDQVVIGQVFASPQQGTASPFGGPRRF